MPSVDEIIKSMEDELMNIYNRQVARGVSTKWSELKLKELKEYEAHQARVIKKAMEKAKKEAQKDVTGSFATGTKESYDWFQDYVFERKFKRLQSSDKWGSFFKINKPKMDAMMKAIEKDFDNAMYATFRKAKDMYRETMVKATANLGSGILTLEQATDLATRDFLLNGINSITYANGAEVNIKSYANMVLRTANKRANLMAQGTVQDEWGIHTVQVSQYGACSDTCLPWQGRVYVDDVYASGTAKESAETGYPLLSVAIADGLFHPNCRHTKMPWFEGVSSTPKALDSEQVRKNSEERERQMYINRTIDKYKRLRDGSYDPTNKAKYNAKIKEWRDKLKNPAPVRTNTKTANFTSQSRQTVQVPRSLKNYEAHVEKRLFEVKNTVTTHLGDVEAKLQNLERKLKLMVDNSDPMMRVPDIQTLKTIEQTKFKNQIELADENIKATRGAYSPDRRKRWSKEMFGWDEDLKGSDLENYGYLGPKNRMDDINHDGPGQYGNIAIKFKRENVLDRTTFTIGDSLGADIRPSKLTDPKITSIERWDIDKFMNKPDSEFLKPHLLSWTYVEAQYHGKLTFDDVQQIFFQNEFIDGLKMTREDQCLRRVRLTQAELGSEFIDRMILRDIDLFVSFSNGDIWDIVTEKLVGVNGVLQP